MNMGSRQPEWVGSGHLALCGVHAAWLYEWSPGLETPKDEVALLYPACAEERAVSKLTFNLASATGKGVSAATSGALGSRALLISYAETAFTIVAADKVRSIFTADRTFLCSQLAFRNCSYFSNSGIQSINCVSLSAQWMYRRIEACVNSIDCGAGNSMNLALCAL